MTDTNSLGRTKTRLIVTAALGATLTLGAAFGLSACGKLGHLEQAPPLYGAAAKSSWSASQVSGGGNQATNSSAASLATERALPDANGPNKSPDPSRSNLPIYAAPLEGVGNAEHH